MHTPWMLLLLSIYAHTTLATECAASLKQANNRYDLVQTATSTSSTTTSTATPTLITLPPPVQRLHNTDPTLGNGIAVQVEGTACTPAANIDPNTGAPIAFETGSQACSCTGDKVLVCAADGFWRAKPPAGGESFDCRGGPQLLTNGTVDPASLICWRRDISGATARRAVAVGGGGFGIAGGVVGGGANMRKLEPRGSLPGTDKNADYACVRWDRRIW